MDEVKCDATFTQVISNACLDFLPRIIGGGSPFSDTQHDAESRPDFATAVTPNATELCSTRLPKAGRLRKRVVVLHGPRPLPQ